MINFVSHQYINVEVRKQVVYLDGKDVGFFEVHDGSKVRAVLGPAKDSPAGYWGDVPDAIAAILREAMS